MSPDQFHVLAQDSLREALDKTGLGCFAAAVLAWVVYVLWRKALNRLEDVRARIPRNPEKEARRRMERIDRRMKAPLPRCARPATRRFGLAFLLPAILIGTSAYGRQLTGSLMADAGLAEVLTMLVGALSLVLGLVLLLVSTVPLPMTADDLTDPKDFIRWTVERGMLPSSMDRAARAPCRRCGRPLDLGARFCPACGARRRISG